MTLPTPDAYPNRALAGVLAHITDVLGVTANLPVDDASGHLPNLLNNFYVIVPLDLLGHRCLLLLERTPHSVTPAVARKHIELAARHRNDLCILVPQAIDAPMRAKLIAQRVPFIVPGNQLYLPDLGIDLREHFRRQRRQRDVLSPAAQMTLLHLLLRPDSLPTTPQVLAGLLGYSAMTMTRVADELEQAGLVQTQRNGRHREVSLADDRKQTWEKAQPLLASPVHTRVWLGALPETPLPLAGLSALAAASDLAGPDAVCLACGPRTSEQLKKTGIAVVEDEDLASAQLEVWTYEPLAVGGAVDPLSLYLSLRDSHDDRVLLALDQVMEAVAW